MAEAKDLRYKPQPKRMSLHECYENYILCGGAVGALKSHALRIEVHGYCRRIDSLRVYLFRCPFPELDEAGLTYRQAIQRLHAVTRGVLEAKIEQMNGDVLKAQFDINARFGLFRSSRIKTSRYSSMPSWTYEGNSLSPPPRR